MHSVLLTVLIFSVLRSWYTSNEIHVPDLSIDLEEIYPDKPFKGRVQFSNTLATGLATLPVDIDNFGTMLNITDEDDAGNNDVWIRNFKVDDFKFSTDYFVDVALFDRIPIYGEGTFKYDELEKTASKRRISGRINLKDLDAELWFYAISNGQTITRLENMVVHIQYKDGPVSITGAMNNPQADEIFNQLFELSHVFLAMWHTYDPQAECLFSPLLEYLSNAHLGHFQANFSADPIECLTKGTPFGDLTTNQIKVSLDFVLRLLGIIS